MCWHDLTQRLDQGREKGTTKTEDIFLTFSITDIAKETS